MTPTDINVIKALKSIERAKEKLNSLQDNCVHTRVFVDWKDGWNGWDYPAITIGTATYVCSKCGRYLRESKEVRHGC